MSGRSPLRSLTVESSEEEVRLLKQRIAALEAQQRKTDAALENALEKARRAERMGKGLDLIHKWAEEKGDDFIIDLIDLID